MRTILDEIEHRLEHLPASAYKRNMANAMQAGFSYGFDNKPADQRCQRWLDKHDDAQRYFDIGYGLGQLRQTHTFRVGECTSDGLDARCLFGRCLQVRLPQSRASHQRRWTTVDRRMTKMMLLHGPRDGFDSITLLANLFPAPR
jgi:hypothetical protein